MNNYNSAVVFESELGGDDLDVYVEYSDDSQKNNQQYVSPYRMNRHKVGLRHFRDARFYDKNLDEAGWSVQQWRRRQSYNDWKFSVRQLQGWENFRRPARDETREVRNSDGSVSLVRRIIPYRVPGLDMKDVIVWEKKLTPANKSKSSDVNVVQANDVENDSDDVNMNTKKFTPAMGKMLSKLRTELNMLQSELGKKINVDAHTIANIEKGNKVIFNPEDKMVKDLAKALGLKSIRYFE